MVNKNVKMVVTLTEEQVRDVEARFNDWKESLYDYQDKLSEAISNDSDYVDYLENKVSVLRRRVSGARQICHMLGLYPVEVQPGNYVLMTEMEKVIFENGGEVK